MSSCITSVIMHHVMRGTCAPHQLHLSRKQRRGITRTNSGCPTIFCDSASFAARAACLHTRGGRCFRTCSAAAGAVRAHACSVVGHAIGMPCVLANVRRTSNSVSTRRAASRLPHSAFVSSVREISSARRVTAAREGTRRRTPGGGAFDNGNRNGNRARCEDNGGAVRGGWSQRGPQSASCWS